MGFKGTSILVHSKSVTTGTFLDFLRAESSQQAFLFTPQTRKWWGGASIARPYCRKTWPVLVAVPPDAEDAIGCEIGDAALRGHKDKKRAVRTPSLQPTVNRSTDDATLPKTGKEKVIILSY
jgi:hypothetical protein